MTPESSPRLTVASLHASGRWDARRLGEPVTLFIEAHEVVVRIESTGEELAVPFSLLTGAAWRGGVLSLHREGEELQLQGGETLDRAWHTLTTRACRLPEVARALRALGGSRDDAGARRDDLGPARQRFFAPLMQARRRLAGEVPLEWLVAGFDAVVLTERIRGVVGTLAAERQPTSLPHRRAMEARLLDACDALFMALDRADAAGKALAEDDEARRFVRWRAWAEHVRLVFVEAGRAWRALSAQLVGNEDAPSPPPRAR